jgi:enoyl-CoA hydratase
MNAFETLITSIENGILTILVNRPDKLNALNQKVLEEIGLAIRIAYDNQEVLGVIITGSGDKAFVAGADIGELKELNEMNGRKFSESGQEIFSSIEKCPKPVIAAVNGFALGGGCELAMACHIRIASSNAKFGQPEVSLGIIPGYGGTQRLTQLVGKGKAMELMMTGNMIGAEEALKLGLVNILVEEPKELIPACKDLLGKISKKAPLAISLVIDTVNASFNKEENGYQTEANSFAACCKTADFKEGVEAFLEKRKPEFKGE